MKNIFMTQTLALVISLCALTALADGTGQIGSGFRSTTSTSHAKDTDEVRKALLQAKQSIEMALDSLGQTRFSETLTVKPAMGDQCSNHPVHYGENQNIISNVDFLTKQVLAECGSDCTTGVKYIFSRTAAFAPDLGSCTITAVAFK